MRVVISGRGEELENIYIYIHSHASRRNVRSDLLSDQELLELGFTLLTLQDIDGAADVWTVNQYLGQLNDVAEAVQATTQSARPFGVFGKEYCRSASSARSTASAGTPSAQSTRLPCARTKRPCPLAPSATTRSSNAGKSLALQTM